MEDKLEEFMKAWLLNDPLSIEDLEKFDIRSEQDKNSMLYHRDDLLPLIWSKWRVRIFRRDRLT